MMTIRRVDGKEQRGDAAMNRYSDFLNALSCILRVSIINMVTQGTSIAVLVTSLKRKRPLFPSVVYLVCKGIIMVILMEIRTWYHDAEWSILLTGAVGMCTAAGAIMMIIYTYDDDVVKLMLAIAGSEIIAETVAIPGVALTNFLEGRKSLLVFRDVFQSMDLLILMSGGLVFTGIYLLLLPMMKKFREYEIRRRKTVTVILVAYMALGQLQVLSDYRNSTFFVVSKYLFTLFFSGVLIFLVYWIVKKYQREIQLQRDFLLGQQSRIEQHYQGVRDQIRRMEQNQGEISIKMKSITDRRNAGKNARAENLQNRPYLDELRMEYSRMQKGMYCSNLVLDEVLCCQKEAAETLGIQVEYSMSGCIPGKVGSEELAQILFCLLDYGIRENEKQGAGEQKQIRLHAGTVKNQLILDFYTRGTPNAGFLRKMFQEFLEKYDGAVAAMEEKTGSRIIISLQNA